MHLTRTAAAACSGNAAATDIHIFLVNYWQGYRQEMGPKMAEGPAWGDFDQQSYLKVAATSRLATDLFLALKEKLSSFRWMKK